MTTAARPTTSQIRQALENAIVDGRFALGQKLNLDSLAAEFKCSRTPIRDALQALDVSGLVRIASKRGTFVTELGIVELTERFEVMAELEAMCARLAAARMTSDELVRIRSAQEACEEAVEAGDIDAYYHRNTVFHQAIYAASGNRFLENEATNLQTKLQPYRRRQLQVRGRMTRSMHEHQSILSRLETGDSSGASMEMRAHVIIQGDRFYELISTLRHANSG